MNELDILRTLADQGAMIERLVSDSRRADSRSAFLAYPGESADGRRYIGDALGRGAAAVLWEREGFSWKAEWSVPNVAVHGLKAQAGFLAHALYGKPSEKLWVCGVTGTNGKTSTSYWIAHCLGGAVIGTLGSGSPGAFQPVANTTPDALELHEILKNLVEKKTRAVAMEVSSHGLVQGRVNGVAFDCAVFTNLTQDHLDYHGTMEAYGEAKARLFDAPGLGAAVVNLDDPFGAKLAGRLAGRVRVIGYGLAERAAAKADEYLPARLLDGIETGQVGRFNVSNVLAVVGALRVSGCSLEESVRKTRNLPPVPGRMQRIGDRPLVVVDYAHTPDALEKVLQALRPVAQARGGKLVAVFGAGGDRDPAKRPLMGAVVARLADRALVTSDNPRGEDPLQIIRQVKDKTALESEADRASAIERAILEAGPDDVVLIAGKGHEETQEIAGRRLPFSDAAAARAALARRNR